MVIIAAENPIQTVIDANVLIALCAKEPTKFAVATEAVQKRAKSGAILYAPGVVIAETLFVLCRQLADGILSSTNHARSIQRLDVWMRTILPPGGDASLVLRAEQIRGAYGCSHSADGIYLALTEMLAQTGDAELLTFDAGLYKQASVMVPAVTVSLLIPA